MVRQPGIQDGWNCPMPRQKIGYRPAITFMLFHPYRQRLDPTQDQEAFKRRQNASSAFLHEGECLLVLWRGRHQHSPQDHHCVH